MHRPDIAIFIHARKHSRRCKNKLLRPFAGSTLIDILLKKLRSVRDYPIYFAACEAEFLERARRYDNLICIKRTRASAEADSDPSRIFEALQHIPFEYVAWINPSHPFLTMKTFLSAIRYFEKHSPNSLTAVKRKKAWLYQPDARPITNKKNLQVDTVLSDWVYEVAHSFHIYRRDYMLRHGRPWPNTKGDPALFEIPHDEAWDIDTEEEFIMVEALYKIMGRG